MNKYILRIITDNEDIKKLYENHTHYNEGDSGVDLFSLEDLYIKSSETIKIKYGISCEVIKVDENDNYVRNVSYWLLPRSSISKTPLRMSNSVGLIDAHYQGEIIGVVDNIKNNDYTIKKNTRLFQLVSCDLTPFYKVVVVNNFLDESKRRSGGFGSTGV